MEYDPADFEAFQQLYEGVSRMPEDITPPEEFAAAMRRYRPDLAEGRRERVLLSISVGATGTVEQVRAVQPMLPVDVAVVAICHDEAGNVISRSGPEVTSDPAVMRAAEAIGRAMRFRPAEKDGSPVAFPDYRMSIEFGGGTDAKAGSDQGFTQQ